MIYFKPDPHYFSFSIDKGLLETKISQMCIFKSFLVNWDFGESSSFIVVNIFHVYFFNVRISVKS